MAFLLGAFGDPPIEPSTARKRIRSGGRVLHHEVRRLVSFAWVLPVVSALAASSFVAAGCSKDGVIPGAKAAGAFAEAKAAPLPSLVLSRFASAPVKRAA